jgi:hypothetical protein
MDISKTHPSFIMNDIRKKTTYERILELISLIMLCGAIFPFLYFGKLAKKASVPIHFGLSGKVDGWGNPYWLWLIPTIAVAFYIVLKYFDKHYKKINYPVKTKNKEMANALYWLGIRQIRRLKPIVMAIFCYLSNVTFFISTHNANRLLCLPVLYLLIGGMLSVALFYLIKMIGLRKKY